MPALHLGAALGRRLVPVLDDHLAGQQVDLVGEIPGLLAVDPEDARHADEKLRAEIDVVRSENTALQSKVLTTEEKCRDLYSQVRLTEGVQKAYEELRRTQQVVVQQERLRALGQMASGVAHDINNALCPVTCYPDMVMSNEAQLSDNSRRYLQNAAAPTRST